MDEIVCISSVNDYINFIYKDFKSSAKLKELQKVLKSPDIHLLALSHALLYYQYQCYYRLIKIT